MAGGAGGAMAHPRIQIVGFFGNFRFCRKITDFGLALSTFDQFRFFALVMFLAALCTRASQNYEDLVREKVIGFGRHC